MFQQLRNLNDNYTSKKASLQTLLRSILGALKATVSYMGSQWMGINQQNKQSLYLGILFFYYNFGICILFQFFIIGISNVRISNNWLILFRGGTTELRNPFVNCLLLNLQKFISVTFPIHG